MLKAKLAAATKNSANSSKPPSSDIVKPASAARKGRKKRRRGEQPGHPNHEREAFEPSAIGVFTDHVLERCPGCGGPLEMLAEPARVLQQVEVLERPLEITEHRSRVCRGGKRRQEFVAPIPPEIRRAGLVGPRLTALIGYLKGVCPCSFSTIRTFLNDVCGVSISPAVRHNIWNFSREFSPTSVREPSIWPRTAWRGCVAQSESHPDCRVRTRLNSVEVHGHRLTAATVRAKSKLSTLDKMAGELFRKRL